MSARATESNNTQWSPTEVTLMTLRASPKSTEVVWSALSDSAMFSLCTWCACLE